MILACKLMLAHLLGDFFLQKSAWVLQKEKKKLAAPFLYFHSLLHGLLTWLFVWEIGFWKMAIFIAVFHFLIDTAKLIFQKKKTKRAWFFFDQFLHLLILILVWEIYSKSSIFNIQIGVNFWFLITTAAFLTFPTSFIIKFAISRWTPPDSGKDDSLKSAGQYIGILERLFVFVFILLQQWVGIGFLLAAKSIFRFGDLRGRDERSLTEYVLIGTLLSFGLAVLVGLLADYLI